MNLETHCKKSSTLTVVFMRVQVKSIKIHFDSLLSFYIQAEIVLDEKILKVMDGIKNYIIFNI